MTWSVHFISINQDRESYVVVHNVFCAASYWSHNPMNQNIFNASCWLINSMPFWANSTNRQCKGLWSTRFDVFSLKVPFPMEIFPHWIEIEAFLAGKNVKFLGRRLVTVSLPSSWALSCRCSDDSNVTFENLKGYKNEWDKSSDQICSISSKSFVVVDFSCSPPLVLLSNHVLCKYVYCNAVRPLLLKMDECLKISWC